MKTKTFWDFIKGEGLYKHEDKFVHFIEDECPEIIFKHCWCIIDWHIESELRSR